MTFSSLFFRNRRASATIILVMLSIQCTANAFSSITTRRISASSINPYGASDISLNSVASGGDSEVDTVIDENAYDWRNTARSVFADKDQRPVILFDGVCNLCNGGVNFALDRDPVGYFRFASLQSKVGQSLLMRSNKKADDISSIVLVDANTSYFKSEAVLRIAQKLDGPLPVLGFGGVFVPGFLRNTIYDFVADNRYRLGKREDSCRLEDEQFDDRFIPDPE